jgi:hypothetical protein
MGPWLNPAKALKTEKPNQFLSTFQNGMKISAEICCAVFR